MQIDRRITNGLAWAGAVLVVAVPLADFAIRQAMPDPSPQLAVVREEASEPVTVNTPPADGSQVAQAETPVPTTETPRQPATSTNGDPVDSFLESGRNLPSYISGSDAPTTPRPITPAPATPAPAAQPTVPAAQPTAPTPQPTVPATQTAAPPTQAAAPATTPRTPVTLPTPVSQRPPSVPQSQVRPSPAPVQAPALQPPLIVDEPAPVFTADDLDDWESGPLSEFLANRGGQVRSAPAPTYDEDGFFLDQGPSNRRQETFPRAYGEGFYYPFAE